jgi:futalosine hydrolase
MQILLCAATTFELAPTIDLLESNKFKTNYSIDILITGVGLMAATYQLTRYILTHKPYLIIQSGVGGCLDERIALGQTVVIKNETVGDSGVQEDNGFKTLFDLNLIKNNNPWKEGQLENPYTDLLKASGLLITNGVTVNEISTNPDRINFYKKNLKASIESLEGAALHYTALLGGIPFLQLRSVSNYIGERNKQKWKLKEAIENLNTELQRILLNL